MKNMIENIFIGVLAVIVAVSGVWVWWYERGGFKEKDADKTANSEKKTDKKN